MNRDKHGMVGLWIALVQQSRVDPRVNMSQRARFCQRREALQKLQHRARRLPDDIVSKPRSVVQRDDELQIKVRTPPRPSGYCARSSPVEDSPSPDPESRVPDISCDARRDGSTPGNRLDSICEEEEEKEEAICGEEEDTICEKEKDAICEKEEDAICGEEEEKEEAICGEEEDTICEEEEDVICEKEEDAICGEEEDAICGEEEAICGEEEDAICGEEDASIDDVDLESLSSIQSEYIGGKKRGSSRKTKWWRKLCCWLRQEDTDDELE
ncbi:hypothetical protein Bbelb_412080 [Branchiostoma belcheri]|nr:hypothetical protein Bbelb_412080 [Branchiostoma belcheri]